MNPGFSPHRRFRVCLIAAFVLGSAGGGLANDKRALGQFKGTYKGAWKAAGNLPLTLKMPKGKGRGKGRFEATPCTDGDDLSPLKLKITKYQVRRNGRKLISTGKATWERSKVPALLGGNLTGNLKVNAVLRGSKATARGRMTTGRLAGRLDIKKGGSLRNAVCAERSFTFSGVPAAIPDDVHVSNEINGTLVASLTVPNGVAVIDDLDVSVSIVSTFNADYVVTLRHVPTGIEVELFSDIGFNDDGIFVRLDDDAATDIATVPNDPADLPVVGTFRPENPAALAAFSGVLGSGLWQLIVEDNSAGLTGQLTVFTLHIE